MKKLSKIIATLFYAGFFPYAPGTLGSLLGISFYYFLFQSVTKSFSPLLNIGLFVTILALVFSDYYEYSKGEKDPSEIIIDEFAAILLFSIFAVPKTFVDYTIIFILFRFFDVLKPYPIKKVEDLPAGAAVVLDDLMAALYGYIIYFVIKLVI